MRKIIIFILTLTCLFTLSLSTTNVVTAAASSTYYSGTEGLTGDDLLNKLAEITKNNHTYYNTYGETRYVAAKTDGDPNNSSNFLDLYTRLSVDATWDAGVTWNREHVWCKSLSGGLFTSIDNSGRGAGADIHHIRPTYESINSSRSNKLYTDFDWITATGSAKYYNGALAAYQNSSYWEPIDDVKGDIARILMYLYMHYSTEVSYNKTNHANYSGNLKITSIVYAGGNTEKTWSLLLYWNDLDPVDDFEAKRNDECAKITGTRNPFIDNMNFCDAIWGDGTDTPTGYFVNYNLPSGALFNYTDNTKYTSGSKIQKPTVNPSLSGHTFEGWYKDSNYNEEWDFNADTITPNVTLYAKFTDNNAAEFEELFNTLEIKSQLIFNVEKIEDTAKINDQTLRIRYVLQFTAEQFNKYSSLISKIKLYVNGTETVCTISKVGDEYRLVCSIEVKDNVTTYTPTFSSGASSLTIDGYSVKTLAQYYLDNLISDETVKLYSSYLAEISK